MNLQMTVNVESFEELQRAYDNFSRNLKINLKNYTVVLSDLPQSFSMEDVNESKVVLLNVKITKLPSLTKSLDRS